MPIVLLKAWAWVKAYWYIPLIIAVVIIGLLTRKKDLIDWASFIGKARDSHKKELDAIERAHADELAAREAALKRMETARAAIEAEFRKNQVQIDVQKQKEIDRILKKTRDDPDAMASEIESRLGFKVVVID